MEQHAVANDGAVLVALDVLLRLVLRECREGVHDEVTQELYFVWPFDELLNHVVSLVEEEAALVQADRV